MESTPSQRNNAKKNQRKKHAKNKNKQKRRAQKTKHTADDMYVVPEYQYLKLLMCAKYLGYTKVEERRRKIRVTPHAYKITNARTISIVVRWPHERKTKRKDKTNSEQRTYKKRTAIL